MPSRRLHDDGVREAEQQLDGRAPQRRAVADALDLEPLLVAVRHALDHVGHERAREAVERAVRATVRGARDRDDALGDAHGHLVRDDLLERALWGPSRHAARRDVDLDAGGQR